MRRTDILIVGQGPYGLALANYLADQGQEFTIVGQPMDLWRNHTFSEAALRSDRATSEIAHPRQLYSIGSYRKAQGRPVDNQTERVTVKEYRSYIDWVYTQLPYTPLDDYVEKIFYHQDHYVAILEHGGVLEARQVVIATGVAQHLNVPAELKVAGDVIHAYHTRQIESLAHKKVLVVGAGQSAAEAMEICLKHNNQVDWYAREAPRYYAEPLDLPKWIFNLVVKSAGLFRRLPPALIKRVFSIFSATTITPEYESKLARITRYDTLPNLKPYDHVIAATGYRYSLNHMQFLGDQIRKELKMRAAMPQIDKNFMSSKQNLYFIGPATEAFFGPPMKFMIGSQYVAPRLSRILAG